MADETTVDTQTATVNADTVVVNNPPTPAATSLNIEPLSFDTPPVQVSQKSTTQTQTEVSIPPEVTAAVQNFFTQTSENILQQHGAQLNALAESLISDIQGSANDLLQNVVRDRRSIYFVAGLVGFLAAIVGVLLLTWLYGSPTQAGHAEEILKFVGPLVSGILLTSFHHYSK